MNAGPLDRPMISSRRKNAGGKIFVRIATVIVTIPLALIVAIHPSLETIFDLVVTAGLVIGVLEYYRFVTAAKGPVIHRWMMVFGVIIIGAAAYMDHMPMGFTFVVVAMCFCHLYLRPPTLLGTVAETFGLVYIGWLGSYLILIRALPHGAGHMLLLFVSVWLTDTGAYLVGSAVGRWKLSPRISPNKTVEGAVGGLLLAVLGAALLKQVQIAGVAIMPAYTMQQYIIVAALASIVGQYGDFVESALKREAQVKDSGSLFPGHGGLLDRCDSLLFAAPVIYYCAKLVL